ncbi:MULTISPECIES: hypothetical protein [unclassified Rhizobium]|uniref:hypothetical protein n=1 Tax=unclassified Rhizobium TaxID=2613769 RepID=UPI00131A58E0|nr:MULTISPECIES: hypothetical protein [Rhizobium]UWU24416.1 hypothetical protein N2601_19880 [Rhizobium tropici]
MTAPLSPSFPENVVPNLIPFPAQNRARPDVQTSDTFSTAPEAPDLLQLLARKREMLSNAAYYLEALCASLKGDVTDAPHLSINADMRPTQNA